MSILHKDNNGNIIEYSGNSCKFEGLPLGSIFASAIPQLSKNYHLLNGDNLGIVEYQDFYTLLTTLIAQSYNLTCTANEYAEDIAKTGNCGKFVINATSSEITGTYTDSNDNTTTITISANSFKLPTLISFIQSVSSIMDLGNSVEAGLPNITGSMGIRSMSNGSQAIESGSKSLYRGTGGAVWQTSFSYTTNSQSNANEKINFDASRSSSIYGHSTTVQPNSIQYLYYIVLKNNSVSGLMNYLNQGGVSSLGNAIGDITLGGGLNISNNVLNQNVWVNKYLKSFDSTTLPTTAQTIDLSTYIDNYDANGEYEIFIKFYLSYRNTSNYNNSIYFKSDILTTYFNPVYVALQGDNFVNSFVFPVKRYLYYYYWKSLTPDRALIEIYGYRRIK